LFFGEELANLDERLREAGNLPLNASVSDFQTNAAYFPTIYVQGARFLDELRGVMGDLAFEAALAEEVRIFRGKLASPLAVLDLFQRQTAANLHPVIGRYFSYAAYSDPAPLGWRLELPAGAWRDSVGLTVRADFAISRAEVWLDGRLIAVGAQPDLGFEVGDLEAGEYLLLVRVWDQRGVQLERAERVVIAGT
jgi:hypothetical protein